MALVKCDGCGDQHNCSAVADPAGGKTKTKRKLSPALEAANAARRAEAEARRTSGGSTTTQTKPKSIVRELLGF